jgi:2-keto-4-pentenoate hydratase/2-oxohepta-3-ene-1,7-dioic acid hydratase in catechol pathway
MKILSYEIMGEVSLGIMLLEENKLVDLKLNAEALLKEYSLPREVFTDLKTFIEHDQAFQIAKQIEDDALKGKIKKGVYELDKVKILPPIRNPSKIICTGLNFEDYRRILGLQYLPVPQIFLKAPSAIIGHMDPIEIPESYGKVYHEYELACIISKKCKNVNESIAEDYIFGYTIFNDITAHDIELLTRELQQWAKSIDTFAPIGPVVVTKDELRDISNLKMVRRRNGIIESESNTKYMRFKFNEIISFISTFITLNPGDIITSGSPPAGPIYPGDLIEAEIEGIGVLRNPVVSVKVREDYAKALNLK